MNKLPNPCFLHSLDWDIPVKSGDWFPPTDGFTINTISGNRAVLFGGRSPINSGEGCPTNDVFILSFSYNRVVSYLYTSIVY